MTAHSHGGVCFRHQMKSGSSSKLQFFSEELRFRPLMFSARGLWLVTVAFVLPSIAPVAPGLFAADASGRGLPAALVLRVNADGSQ
jgi:hypothetical protein